ncbi:MAG: helix-turn-helix domain-containing protein [Roseburia sp.]|nr:helix-turn-helix domain-containing protein [Roseburia sp.]
MFAENLKKIMEQKGITSATLARKSGFSKGAISQWRNGIYTPSHKNMLVLAEVLQCSVEELNGKSTAPPCKCAIRPVFPQKTTLTCKEAAALMHKHENYVAQGLQEGRPGFEFGSAVKTSGKWSYFISAAKFTEITGLAIPTEI